MRKTLLPRTTLALAALMLLAAAVPVSGSLPAPVLGAGDLAEATGTGRASPSGAEIYFSLHDSPRVAPADGEVTFRYTLVNLGSFPVTVLVTADEPLGSLRVAASPYLHVLPPLQGVEGYVTVDAAGALPGTYAIPVRATVQEDSRASLTRTAILVLTPPSGSLALRGVSVDITPDEQSVPSGGVALLDVYVTNTGLLPATVDVRVWETSGRLSVQQGELTLTLGPGERSLVSVWVETHPRAEGTFVVRAEAMVREWPGASAADEALLHVYSYGPPTYGHYLDLAPPSQAVPAGETAHYEVRLTSVSRYDQTVSLSAYETSWTLPVSLGARSVHLPAGGSVTVRLAVETTNRTSGDFHIAVESHVWEDPSITTSVYGHLSVLQTVPPPASRIALGLGPRNQTVAAGETAVFNLKVWNGGNATMTVDLRAHETDHRLPVWLSQESIRVAPGETVLVQVLVNTTSAREGTYGILAYGVAREDPDTFARDHAHLTVTRPEA